MNMRPFSSSRFPDIRKCGVAAVLVLLLSAPSTAADALWEAAVTVFAENAELLPGRIELQTTEYGGRRRRVRNEEHGIYRVTYSADGEQTTEVVSVVRNGEDITHERRSNDDRSAIPGFEDEADDADAVSGASDQMPNPVSSSPFDPDNQRYVTYRRESGAQRIDGRRALEYSFRQQIPDDAERSIVGTAWLDAQSGAPLRVESTIDPLPSRLLEYMRFTSYFSGSDVGRHIHRLEVDVAAQVLLVRREYETSVTFSNYFRP